MNTYRHKLHLAEIDRQARELGPCTVSYAEAIAAIRNAKAVAAARLDFYGRINARKAQTRKSPWGDQ